MKAESVIQHLLQRCQTDTGFLAAFKKADNLRTESYCWEYLVNFGVNLEKDWERLPYVTVLSAAARAHPKQDGFLDFGVAIAQCYDDGNTSDQAKAKLRRILACNTVEELCPIIRPMFRLMQSRQKSVSYSKILNDLLWFNNNPKRIKTHWAQSFFGKNIDKQEET